MTERDALLRAVCENPDDDTPRLVFADWLQENGDEARAEFIRKEIEAAKTPSSGPRAWNRDEQRWLAELPSKPGWTWGHFRRGFVESLRSWYAEPVEDVSVIFSAAPIRQLEIAGPQPVLKFLPYLSHLVLFTLNGVDLTDEEIAAIASSEQLENITRLQVFNIRPTPPQERFQPLVRRFGRRFVYAD